MKVIHSINCPKNGLALFLAIAFGSLLIASCGQVANDVVAQSASNTNSPKRNNESNELINSIKQRNFQRVKELVASGADLTARDDRGNTILQVAMAVGNDEITNFLLKSGVSPSMEIIAGISPIETALLHDNDQLTINLIEHGVDVNTKIAGDRSILTDALIKGKTEVAAALINRGANLNVPNRVGRTELFYVSGRLSTVVGLLLKKGADPNFRDVDGSTPLFVAIQNDDVKLVRQLVEGGADVNAHDVEGWTPMKDALVYGCYDIIKILRDNGAQSD